MENLLHIVGYLPAQAVGKCGFNLLDLFEGISDTCEMKFLDFELGLLTYNIV